MTSKPLSISNSQARSIILHGQKLTKSKPFGTGPFSVIKAIEHLGYVQIDTISIVERAHHHVLFSRIPSYQPDWLEKAQYRHRKIFEYWSHAAAFLPMKDYRFSIPVMNVFRDMKDRWPKTSKADMKKVLSRIRSEGPLKSRNFESTHKGGSWWDWKPDKWALQRLFFEGDLMVSHREGFQRVYDIPERIIPEGTDTSTPSEEAYYRHLITTTLRAQGLAARNEISHLRKTNTKVFEKVLNDLQEENIIAPVTIEGSKPYFTLPSHLEQNIRIQERMTILSPFDNLIIWRKRIKEIFDFDYTIECYVPAPKRVFGYFCLPVLYKKQLLGRIDLKADRKSGILQIKKEYWESKFTSDMKELYREALESFAEFNGCTVVELEPK